ncbi:NAD-dependent deacetylase [Thermodesulfobium narugense DSM 14796]|uniref:protein acetyllysine N-acetyltransferase n=1 Tax=Thermodesulfobium narugense DSM 14796 TaxID=747365 RepID=M1E4Y3_9BACT|nr:NAD-dependent deacylase [Thermodesulfobium narugense]AEE13836.1 NAD-dependent deacetylase [Thermodesulfobium narugense DSM 14796]
MDEKYSKTANIIKDKGVVVFSGAGISTESGIPDFRSPTGLWNQEDFISLASIDALYERRSEFIKFYRERLSKIKLANPNKSHEIVAKLEEMGLVTCVITQNIDRLHQKAGSKKVIEIHGNIEEAYCRTCKSIFPSSILDDVEMCPNCGGAIGPNVVLFGEAMPPSFNDSMNIIKRAKACIVIGSSLSVYPAAAIPETALKFNAKLIIINKMKTHLDNFADAVFNESSSLVLEKLYEILTS